MMGSWPNWCESRCFPGNSVDKYGYTEINVAGFGVELNLGATECTTRVKITASSYAAFDKKFVLMLRRNPMPLSSGRLNLFWVVLE